MVSTPKITHDRHTLLLTLLGFGLIYALISLVDHYNLRTYLDTGMLNQALYDFGKGRSNDFTLDISGARIGYFGDHFSPITLLYTPFQYILGSWTLLVIQIASVLYGGYWIHRYAADRWSSQEAIWATAQFLSIWGIFSALAFEVHNNVMAAMLLPAMVYAYRNQHWRSFTLHFLLILLAKENMSLWLAFIMIGLALGSKERNWRSKFSLEIPLAVGSLVYFALMITTIMPSIRGGEGMDQMVRYHHLGETTKDIIVNLLSHPIDSLGLLFINTLYEPYFDGIKAETHWMVLASGGLALIYRPYYLIMLIPIYAQKMLSSDYGFWGINCQYSIEFVPVLSLALVDSLHGKSKVWRKGIAILCLVSTVGATFITMQARKSKWYVKESTAFYLPGHYSNVVDVGAVHDVLETIPDDVPVSCSGALSPHLYRRSSLYHFPIVKDAEYIAVIPHSNFAYPLAQEDFSRKLSELRTSVDFDVLVDSSDILLLRRK